MPVGSSEFSSSFRFFLFRLIFLTFSSCLIVLFFFSTFCFTTSSSAGDATLLMLSNVCVCPRYRRLVPGCKKRNGHNRSNARFP